MVDILMPALSPTMEEGTLAKWLVAVGDTVEAGQVIAEIETDKATMEVEAVDEGEVAELLVPAGTEGVKVNAPIARLRGDGEEGAAPATVATGADQPTPGASAPTRAPCVTRSPTARRTPPARPYRRRAAAAAVRSGRPTRPTSGDSLVRMRRQLPRVRGGPASRLRRPFLRAGVAAARRTEGLKRPPRARAYSPLPSRAVWPRRRASISPPCPAPARTAA